MYNDDDDAAFALSTPVEHSMILNPDSDHQDNNNNNNNNNNPNTNTNNNDAFNPMQPTTSLTIVGPSTASYSTPDLITPFTTNGNGDTNGTSNGHAITGRFTPIDGSGSDIVSLDNSTGLSQLDPSFASSSSSSIHAVPPDGGGGGGGGGSSSLSSTPPSSLSWAMVGTGGRNTPGSGMHMHPGGVGVGVGIGGGGASYSSPGEHALMYGIKRVSLPGNALYEGSNIQRDEYVRLVLQSLRDIGYHQAASVLEAESGYVFESDMVSNFRDAILQGRWSAVEDVLEDMGVRGEEHLRTANFLVRQQKYLEALEMRQSDYALRILRNELAPLSFDSERLHLLSSLMMCTSIEDLMRRAQWSGALGGSRQELLVELQRTIPASVMIPPRRLETLLNQAQDSQRRACLYHNSREPFSLYTDHDCGRSLFPGITTNVLAEHDNEVWNIEWSHDGQFLASGGKDSTIIIWRIGEPTANVGRECSVERVLKDSTAEIAALSWYWDNTILLTASDKTVKMWNVKGGECIKEISDHSNVVTAARWLHDKSGFATSAMDSNIFFYDNFGNRVTERSLTKIDLRVVDFALSPDGHYLVAVGQPHEGRLGPTAPLFDLPLGLYSSIGDDLRAKRTQMIVFDLRNNTRRASQIRVGDMTSVRISPDSRYALINYAPNVVFLWDIEASRLVRRYLGHQHEQHVLRSCFGGANGSWIISGGEDQTIYVWHRDTADVLETMKGHKDGSVNSVAWNPVDDGVFASCSDDGTVRIWEAPTWTGSSALTPTLSNNAKAMFSVRTNGFHSDVSSVWS